MWKSSFILLAVCLMALSFAEEEESVPLPGKCPQINPVETFDLEKYVQGVWYHAYHLSSDSFLELKCMDLRMNHDTEENSVNFTIFAVKNGLPVWYNFTEEYINPGAFQYPESVRNSTEWYYKIVTKILKVDYDNYVIAWACYDIEGEDKHYETLIINARSHQLSEQHVKEIKDFLAEHLPTAQLKPAVWDDCRVTCPAA